MNEGLDAKPAGQPPSGGQDAPLQFDKAEGPSTGPSGCASCSRPLEHEYFDAGGRFICRSCAGQLADDGPRHLLRAAAFGGGAALLGTLVWFLVIKLSGSEFGLIAIAVGLFVGFAVRFGARGRGGARYQALAIVLTYVSITASYVPLVIDGMTSAQESKGVGSDATQGVAATPAPPANPADAPDPSGSAPARSSADANVAHAASAAGFVVALLFVFGLALASPFLGGFSNIMGIIIIGIALYEAWKLNKRVVVTGPYRINATNESATS